MVRGMFHLPSPSSNRKKTTQSSKNAYAKRNNNSVPTVAPTPPFAHDDWKQQPWDDDSRAAGLISEDSAPPAPPGDNSSISSNAYSVPQLSDVPRIAPRRNHGNTSMSPTSQASAAIPKGTVQKNPFLANSNTTNGPLDENRQPHQDVSKNFKQAMSVTQERAMRLQAMEAQIQIQQQPSPTASRKGKRIFGRNKQAGDSPSSVYSTQEANKKGKKKGLLKSFFGGKKHSQKLPHSFSNAPTTPNDGASIAMEMESQATFTVGDIDQISVSQMKERFESSTPKPAPVTNSSDQASVTSRGSKPKPLITTQQSESDPDAFASSLLDLATNAPPKQAVTTPSGGAALPDCDETTVSCLTNPTYFQLSDSRPWPSALDDMSRKSPAKASRKNPTVEGGRPKSPEMGDFFTQKTSLDSWEKSDGFSDPFFNSKTTDSFPPREDDDDDETAIFGSDSANAFKNAPAFDNAFTDEMKTEDFKVLRKQESPKK